MTRAERWVLGAWLAGVAASIAVIVQTEFTADLSAFLPRDPSARQQILVDQLRDGALSKIVLIGVEGGSVGERVQASRRLAAALRSDPAFASVDNGEEQGTDKDRDFLWRNRYLLSPGATPEAFTAQGLRTHLEEDLKLLSSPMGMLVRRTLANDPTRELLRIVEGLGARAHPATQDGVWVSAGGERALLLAQTRAPGGDIDAQAVALAAVRGAFADAARGSEVRLLVAGPAVFSVNTRARIESDALRLSLLATALIASALLFLYRSLRVLGLGSLPVAGGALAGTASVSLAFGSVHGITLAFGVTLLGEAVDYAVYFFTHTAPGRTPRATFERIWPTVRLGVLTSICGFSALLFSSFTGLAQLGLFSVAGLVAAALVTRMVLPALVPAGFSVRATDDIASRLIHLARGSAILRIPVLFAAAAAAALVFMRGESAWSDDIAALSPVARADQVLDQQLRGDLGAPDMGHLIIVNGRGEQQALRASEQVSELLRRWVEEGRLQGFESAASYLPSIATQRARQAALPDAATLRRSLRAALEGLPYRPMLFEPFIADIAAARQAQPVVRADLAGTRMALRLESLLVQRAGGWAGIVFLTGVSDPKELAAGLDLTFGGQAVLLDLKGESQRMASGYRAEALTHALQGCAAIVVLLFLALRSPMRVFNVVLPLAAAVMLTLGVLVWSGAALSIFHLVGLLLVVAVGSNYSLFFERRSPSQEEHRRTLVSLAFANASTVLGFGLLAFSQVPVLQALGVTVGLGAFLALVCSAVLIAGRNVRG